EPARVLVVVATLERLELRGHRERVVPRSGVRELHHERAVALTRDALGGDALALERGLEVFGGTLGLVRDRLGRVDAQHQVNAALEVEAEVDALLRRVEV